MSMMKNMNLPNKLTMIRVFLIPVFVVFMCLSVKCGVITVLREEPQKGFIMMRYVACIVFCVASITDFLDGKIARKRGLVTNFGKFMDPLADKLLVCSALILLSAEQSLPVWVTLLIIAREFIISGIRLVASDNGVVIAASYWGKFKTFSQMVLCIYLILPRLSSWAGPIVTWGLIIISTLLTLISLIDYIVKNRSVIAKGGM